MKTVKVRTYSFLSTSRGLREDTVATDAPTVRALLHELQSSKAIPLTTNIVKASVNNEFVMWDDPFSDGDTVTFLPPFSGG